MEIDISVDAVITRTELLDDGDKPSEEDLNDEDRPEGAKFRVSFLLEDTSKIIEETSGEDRVILARCCFREGIISFHATEARSDRLEQMVYDILRYDMNMEREAATEARRHVAGAIVREIQSSYPVSCSMPCTVFMDVNIDCTTTEGRTSGERLGQSRESTGEHGRRPHDPNSERGGAQLRRRLEEDVCAICCDPCSTYQDIAVTTCQHIYHRYCILRWLNHGTNTCPVCRSNLSHMLHGPCD